MAPMAMPMPAPKGKARVRAKAKAKAKAVAVVRLGILGRCALRRPAGSRGGVNTLFGSWEKASKRCWRQPRTFTKGARCWVQSRVSRSERERSLFG